MRRIHGEPHMGLEAVFRRRKQARAGESHHVFTDDHQAQQIWPDGRHPFVQK